MSGRASPAPKLRLFVALDLPEPARAALARFRDAAADAAVWRPLSDESFHVTLAFLGHRPEDDVERVVAALRELPPWAAPELALGDGLLLPPRRARVLAVALADPDGALAPLQAAVSASLAAAGVYEPEVRPFRPHVTVARLRAGARAPRALDAEPQPMSFTTGPVTLYRSRPGRGGAVYEPLFARSA
ncbi:MAG TPA: RNA 2',3'-cyclic phosphodiesterase [Solirubrobacteraceae bacterium]|nr:RNA 2',3'-cyclic phosphodiesterase [Solirubrobacteraceae bacterium]